MSSSAAILVCACFAGQLALAQTTGVKAEFDAASVRIAASPPSGFGCKGGPGTDDPGLLRCQNFSLSNLVMMAYNLRPFQFSAPDWMDTTRFDLSARIPAGTAMHQFRSMQQNLLAERFKLAVHFAKKQVDGYDLVVGKANVNLKHVDDEEAGEGEQPWRAPIGGPPRRTVALRKGEQESMAILAQFVSDEIGAPVNDATGLKGRYDFLLRWMAEPRGAMIIAPPPGAPAAPTEDKYPGIVGAIKEQLGLGLVKKRMAMDVLTVDHAEKTPTEN